MSKIKMNFKKTGTKPDRPENSSPNLSNCDVLSNGFLNDSDCFAQRAGHFFSASINSTSNSSGHFPVFESKRLNNVFLTKIFF